MKRMIAFFAVVFIWTTGALGDLVMPNFPGSNLPPKFPDFGGKTHYWVAEWNIPSYYVEYGQRDGLAWDGHLLYNPIERDWKVIFIHDGFKRFYEKECLSTDPRRTAWWMSTEPTGTLWESVERAAVSERHPDVTWAIINHMVAWGLVSPNEFRRMSPQRVFRVMEAYTRLAYPDDGHPLPYPYPDK